MKKPKELQPWERTHIERAKIARVVKAAAMLLLETPRLLDERDAHLVADLVERVPTLRLLEKLEELDQAEANESAGRRVADAHDREKKRRNAARRAKPAKKIAKPKHAATGAKPKAAKRSSPVETFGKPEIAGMLEDEALNKASLDGQVKAGDLISGVKGATRGQATGALSRLVARGRLMLVGKGRYASYVLPNGAGGGSKKQLELGEVAPS